MHACTVVARNYLPYARVLAGSFLTHHPNSTLHTLVVDDRDGAVDPSAEPFTVVRPEALLSTDELHRMALIYDVTELSTALKPWLLRHLLERTGGPVTYLDPDCLVRAPFPEIDDLAAEHGIVLVPHTTEPIPRDGAKVSEFDILSSGIYNLGFIAVGRAVLEPGGFLDWWSERLRRDCIIDHHAMLFTDQRWADFAPALFGAHVLRDPTLDVAYWNLAGRDAGTPIRFFHFSGFDPARPWLLSKHQEDKPRFALSDHPELTELCQSYADTLRKEGWEDARHKPYGWGALANGLGLDTRMRRLFRTAVLAEEAGGPRAPSDPFNPDHAAAFVDWLHGPVAPPLSPYVSRYLTELHREKREISAAFDLASEPDRYIDWLLADGARAYRVPYELLPREDLDDARPSWPPPPPIIGVQVVRSVGHPLGDLATATAGALGAPIIDFDGHALNGTAPHDATLAFVAPDQLRHFTAQLGRTWVEDRHLVLVTEAPLTALEERVRSSIGCELWDARDFVPFPTAVAVPAAVPAATVGQPGSDRARFVTVLDLRRSERALVPARAWAQAFPDGTDAGGPQLVVLADHCTASPVALEGLRAIASSGCGVSLIEDPRPELRDRYVATCAAYLGAHQAGFPTTTALALAAGRPVVAPRISFAAEDSYYPVPAGDVSATSRRIREIVADPDGAQRRGARSASALGGASSFTADRCRRVVTARLAEMRARQLAFGEPPPLPAPAQPTALDELHHHLSAGPALPAAGRVRSAIRSAVLRLIRPWTWHQEAVDRTIAEAVAERLLEAERDRTAVAADRAATQRALDRLRAEVKALVSRPEG